MTTPYALWEHVPLSECRELWRAFARHTWEGSGVARRDIEAVYLERACAAANDELTKLERMHAAILHRYNVATDRLAEARAQLATVTAERDALLADLHAIENGGP